MWICALVLSHLSTPMLPAPFLRAGAFPGALLSTKSHHSLTINNDSDLRQCPQKGWHTMSQTPTAPLVGVSVLDLSRLLPGGYASQMLADLGADVLKIEEPGLGDYARTMPQFTRTVGQAFLAVNRDKRSV